MYFKKRLLTCASWAVAGLALSLPLQAQHEVDSAADQGPVKINGNENAFGYSQMAMMAMMQKMPEVNRYAFEEGQEFVQAVAMREMVPPEFILPTPGSGPVLHMTALALAEPGKNVVTVTPGYQQFIRVFKAAGGEVKEVPVNDDLAYDLPAIKAAIDENTVAVYICNPNNPTGTIVDPDELRAFIKDLPDGVLAFADEAYLELAPGGLEKNSMIDLVRAGEDVIVSRTFSKVYGMAGLRLGYGVAKPEILKKLRLYYYGGPDKLALVAGTASLQDPGFFDMSVSSYTAVREMVKGELDAMGIEYADPNGSFIFMKTGVPIEELQSLMEAENVLIGRPFPPLLDWARVSIGTEEEMQVFLRAFKKVMASKGLVAAG